jgi:hypothetical protein
MELPLMCRDEGLNRMRCIGFAPYGHRDRESKLRPILHLRKGINLPSHKKSPGAEATGALSIFSP